MSEADKEKSSPIIALQFFTPFSTSVRQIEELQSAVRGEFGLLDEVEKNASTWMARRQEALESGLRALAQMSTVRDPFAAGAIWSEWLSGSLKRMAADLGDASAFAIKSVSIGQKAAEAMVNRDSENGEPGIETAPQAKAA